MLSFPKPRMVHDPKVHVDVWTSQMFQRSRMVLQDASSNAFHNLARKPACSRKLEYIPGVCQRTMFGYDAVFDLVFGYIRPGSWGVRQFRNATALRKDLPVFYPVPSHMARVVVSVRSTLLPKRRPASSVLDPCWYAVSPEANDWYNLKRGLRLLFGLLHNDDRSLMHFRKRALLNCMDD
jgi:hypothetical protein